MKFSRRSLSACFGSWCVQLVYNPRAGAESRVLASAEETEIPRLGRALLPAFVAIFVAVASACYALAHFIALPAALRVLMTTLALALGVSWGARCGSSTVRRLCAAARWPLALMLALFALSLRWSANFSELLANEPNMQAAIFSGFITLLSVLLIGARSGGRLVPMAAPLVPALSLFGLLCLVAVDGITQTCFLVFAAAALYLLCYDLFLRRAAPDLSSGVWSNAPRAQRMARGDAPAWALQSVLVSSVWFALFLGGGALLFWPLQAVIPNIAAPRWDRGQGDNGERKLDYSGGAPVMELRGGTHALSDRVLLRVTPIRGIPTGTWRGRVYENYERSRWSELPELSELGPPGQVLRLIEPRSLGALKATAPALAPRMGYVQPITELVEPLGGVATVVYSSGLPLGFETEPHEFDPKDPQRTNDLTNSQSPYIVCSFETQPNLRVLDKTRGFDASADNPKLAPALRATLLRNLELPTESDTRATIEQIAAQVRQSGVPTATPSQKARAIAGFLRQHYLYSLQAPTVPPTADATVYFLTKARSGACDMFASSMALLLREMDVPARVATGFLDPQSPESTVEDRDGKTSKILRERDAHAWVEYYVPNYGWLVIDPTQGTSESPPTLTGRLADWLHLAHLDVPPILLVLPLLGTGLLAAGLLWQRRSEPGTRTHEDERQRIEAAYRNALRLLRRRVPHAPHLAPGEYEHRVATTNVPAAAKQEFSALTHLYLAARYGPAPDASRAQVDECLLRLKAALRQKTE